MLSRCQRFDLRRVDVETLRGHFARVAGLENAAVEDDALTLIARAAEGSVRDGLSILDQAIAHGTDGVTGADVRAMLGLADRGRVFELLDVLFRGDAKGALNGLRELYDEGAEPVQIIADLAEAVHVVTRIAAAGKDAADPTLSEAERTSAEELAERLDMGILARAWQALLKGLEEASSAPQPLTAAEMVLIRLAYMADLPSPRDLARALEGDQGEAGVTAARRRPLRLRSRHRLHTGTARQRPSRSRYASRIPGSTAKPRRRRRFIRRVSRTSLRSLRRNANPSCAMR